MTNDKGTILVVDDDMLNRVLLSTNLQEAGYTVEMAEDGMQALAMLHAQPFDVVLLDLEMPGLDGYQVLERIKGDQDLRHIPVIIVSSVEEMASVVRCIEMGATDHLPKPFDPVLLHARINASLATKRLHEQEEISHRQMEDYSRQLESRVLEQTQQLRESYESLRKVQEGTVFALSSLVEMRDPYTAGHQRHVSQLACAVASEMGLPESQIEGIRVAGLLHDIGKVCVPAEILSKPGRISEIEFAVIATHSQVGYDILKTVDFPWPIAQIVYQHHEKLDGTGYPCHLVADDILLEAKVLSVADVVEAIAYHRPYRPALGSGTAIEEISKKSGAHFEPDAVAACMSVFREKDFVFE
ncbi:MAG: response regulator [Armatimonadetes bacterium]|nr:response regulator [Armatimonadota bacterium]